MQRLVDFATGGGEWAAVNDGVMGGLSRSSIRPGEDGTGLFTGELSLENNGGFASVRTVIGPIDLSDRDGLEVRVRGDGRPYQVRLRAGRGFDGIAYRAFLEAPAGEWRTVRLPFADFAPVFRGRVVAGAPPLDTSRITQLGFLLADKRDGSFALEIEYVAPWIRERNEQ